LADERTVGAFYRQWRLMSLDGTCLDVADTAANEEEFGRPGTGRGQGVGAFPQLRLVALSETGTHAICAAAMGPLSRGENALADALVARLEPGMLCLADRGLYSFARFKNARQTGAQLLWRVGTHMLLPREQQLPDGSYLTRIYPNQPDQRARRNGEQVRVVEYQIDDGLSDPEQRYRLLCTILEPEHAAAAELGVLYHERWEIENALDELKVHQRGPRVVLRSKAPDGVYQEAYGYLCTHYAIRRLMHDAALRADVDPDRLSFTRSLRAARRSARTQPGFSPPRDRHRTSTRDRRDPR
jgi:DDE family transposase